jgi:RNase H-like domain found in reverse transcriptase
MGISPDDLLQKTKQVFNKLNEAGLRMHGEKCQFAAGKIKFLLHQFEGSTMSINLDKVDVIRTYPRPQNIKELRAYLGMAQFYRRFLQHHSKTTYPLRQLLKVGQKCIWTDECQAAFEAIKQSLISEPVLRLPDYTQPFILMTDASQKSIGFHLLQRHNGRLHAVSYSGKALLPSQKCGVILILNVLLLFLVASSTLSI